jgi:hypothetical protein
MLPQLLLLMPSKALSSKTPRNEIPRLTPNGLKTPLNQLIGKQMGHPSKPWHQVNNSKSPSMSMNGLQPCTTKLKLATRLTDDTLCVATSKKMCDTCYCAQAPVDKLPAPKPSTNSTTTSHDTTPQPPCHLSSLTASDNGSLVTNPP